MADLRARSPLSGRPIPLPRYFSPRDLALTDLFENAPHPLPTVTDAEVRALVADLGATDHWRTPADAVTNPYRGPSPATPYDGTAYLSKHVGDVHDTSPYDPRTPPAEPPYTPAERPSVISTAAFVANTGKLIAWLSR